MALIDGLTAYWSLNSGGTGNETDLVSSLELTAANTPGTASVSGRPYPNVRTFGTTKRLYTANDLAATQFGTDPFTVAAWAYPTLNGGTSSNGVFSKRGSVTGVAGAYHLRRDDAISTRFQVSVWNGSAVVYVECVTTVSLDAWTLFCFWRSGNTLFLSANNAGEGTGLSFSATLSSSGVPFNVGILGSDGSSPFSGSIGPVAIWKGRALSADEKTEYYNSGAGLAYEDMGSSVLARKIFYDRQMQC